VPVWKEGADGVKEMRGESKEKTKNEENMKRERKRVNKEGKTGSKKCKM
jgi:hypothetical protein